MSELIYVFRSISRSICDKQRSKVANLVKYVDLRQPRTQGLPARFFKYGRQSGRGPGKRWSRVRQILQDSWSISLRAGFMEIKTGGRRKVHEYYLYSFIFCCNLSF